MTGENMAAATAARRPVACPEGWRVIAHGAGFVEGPVAQGAAIDFVSINRGTVWRAQLDGSAFAVRAELGGGPNGGTADAAGRLWVVQNGGRVMETRSGLPVSPGIQVVDDAGVTTELADPDLAAPNDCVFGPDGRLWFTDPYGRLMPPPSGDPERARTHGRVWAYDPGACALELVAQDLPHPNGLCFDASGEHLYVSDTKLQAVLVLDAAARGVRRPRTVATLPKGQPDGMSFDREGRLWIAATDAEGLAVLSPSGGWDFVPLGPSFPTNVCFAGPDLTTLVVTAARGGRVLVRDNVAPGLPLR